MCVNINVRHSCTITKLTETTEELSARDCSGYCLCENRLFILYTYVDAFVRSCDVNVCECTSQILGKSRSATCTFSFTSMEIMQWYQVCLFVRLCVSSITKKL